MTPIYLRNLPPPDETFNHVQFLSSFASVIKPEHYLELGVRNAICFNAVAPFCSRVTAVDISPISINEHKNGHIFQGPTDAYFLQLTDETFDMVFIDADHSHEQSLKDFENVLPRVIDDGFIFLHDTYPSSPHMFAPDKSNNVYLTAKYIKQHYIDQIEILTLPFNPGLTIVKKIPRHKQLIYRD